MSLPGEDLKAYNVPEAARILRVTDRAVRKWIEAGELEGGQDPVSKRWSVPQRAVHARMGTRLPRRGEAPEDASGRSEELLDAARDLERRLGRAEARAELTERAESTIRGERDRLLSERYEAQGEAGRLHEEARRLREELAAEKSRGFWSRLSGG